MRSIHDFERKMECLRAKIERADICEENKAILQGFDRLCVAEGLSLPRRWKLGEYLYVLSTRYISSPFSSATTDQIWEAVYKIESSNLAPWTKHDFKVAIKKLFKFVAWGRDALRHKDYPDSVAGISTQVKKREKVRIQAADILTEDEVDRLLNAANDTQQKALVSLMYELGARVGEIGSMQIGSVSRDEYSYICDVNGKTGPRSVRVIRSAGPLTAWLNLHPAGDDPAASLWGHMRDEGWTAITYSQVRRLVKLIARSAGLTKRVHPHLFRHSRITHVLAGGGMNESQAKVYFGLVPDSDMMATYSHLLSRDANDAVLQMYGIKREGRVRVDMPSKCGMCAEPNDRTARFCARCGYAMDTSAVESIEKRKDKAEDLLNRFLQRPEVRECFKKMIREEQHGGGNEHGPAPRVPQSGTPNGEGRPSRRRSA